MSRFLYLILFCLWSGHALAINCSSFWEGPFPGHTVRSAVECEKIYPEMTDLPAHLQMYAVPELSQTPFSIADSEIIGEALLHSYKRFEALRDLPEIKLILTKEESAHDAVSYTRSFTHKEACPIVVYPKILTLNKDQMKQMIAMKVFHCFQKKNYPEQVTLVMDKNLGKWWYEGIALFMSNWVYPEANLEYNSSRFGTWNYGDMVPLQTNPAIVANFFQSYYNNNGYQVTPLLELMKSFPKEMYESEIKLFSGIRNVDLFFHQFAQEMYAKTLRDSSGVNAPIIPAEAKTFVVQQLPSQDVSLNIKTQTITPYKLVFPKGGKYRLNIPYYPGLTISARELGGESFGAFPTEVSTECDNEITLEVMATMTIDAPLNYEVKIRIERTPQEECACQVERPITDSCIIGKWEIVHPRVEDHLRRTLQMGPAMTIQKIESTGNFFVEITPDGKTIWSAEPWEVYLKVKQKDGTIMEMRTVNKGQLISKVSNGDGILCNAGLGSTMQATMYMTVRGQTHQMPTNPTVNGIPYRFTYKCNGDILDYMEAIGVGPGGTNMRFDYQLKRIQ